MKSRKMNSLITTSIVLNLGYNVTYYVVLINSTKGTWFSDFLSTTYIRVSNSDTTPFPIKRFNIILKEASYFENSTFS
jgi:hypothetical protein